MSYTAIGKFPPYDISVSLYSSVQISPQSVHDILLKMYLSSLDTASGYNPLIGLGAKALVFELSQDMHEFIG
jgi:hypothetical protein